MNVAFNKEQVLYNNMRDVNILSAILNMPRIKNINVSTLKIWKYLSTNINYW